ncbi:alcohol dehydrogenase GroES-like domain-containing protein, partial [Colletotrichum lupini]
ANINYTGFEFSNSVIIFGVRPIRLLFTYFTILRGAFKIYIINYIKERLGLITFMKTILINFMNKNPIT